MDVDRQETKDCINGLKRIDPELAYLAVLTAEGLKPLSRWEKPLDASDLNLLGELGLLTKQITRTVKTGRRIIETVFGRSAAPLDFYEKRFADKPVDKSADTLRLEGYLFGYPPCCIEQHIRHPYAPNNLPPKDQRILFHWACKNCNITPALLPAYKRIFDSLNRI